MPSCPANEHDVSTCCLIWAFHGIIGAFETYEISAMSETEIVDLEQKALEANEQIKQRKQKLSLLREQGVAYRNGFERSALAAELHDTYLDRENEALEALAVEVTVAGRVMTKRTMGKVMFIHMQDMSGQIQLFVGRDNLAEGYYAQLKTWDLGDIVWAKGQVFRTKTGELSIRVKDIQLLTKSLRPLPDKYHGLTDVEQRYRQRYLDLMVNAHSRKVFEVRSKVVSTIRQFLETRGFVEVETPMMHAQPGGAAAKPFETHHNALDMDLYLRIAPELYLKRLVVGGVERVFEINRNFRNEGISTRHNPEFTMLEFYMAYATYEDTMNLTEAMFCELAQNIHGSTTVHYQGLEMDLSKPFTRMTIKEAIMHYAPDIAEAQLDDLEQAQDLAKKYKLKMNAGWGLGKIQMELFEEIAEKELKYPTFITEFPAEVSPLSRANDDNPFVTDRFELYAGGQELANSFSELNDPEDQAARFKQQIDARAHGDDEAMSYDEDYIQALEYGLPPTAGEGIGIDRLVMFFTDSASIRDVILFPLMKNI
jgi:lysyl-tRNA synthetase, class II